MMTVIVPLALAAAFIGLGLLHNRSIDKKRRDSAS